MADWGVAASGTLVAAVLETAGYHYQGYALEALRQPFFQGSVGGFVYLIGIVVAIFHTAIRGGYKFGPWLLIGPPLFFSMIVPTQEVRSVLWQFATQDRDQAKVEKEYQQLAIQGSVTSATVSKVFARYNTIVSRSIQEIVKVINNQKTQTDRWFILRAQLLGQMNTHTVESAGLKQLIQHALFDRCGTLVSAAQTAEDPSATEARQKAARADMERFSTDFVVFHPSDTILQYMEQRVYGGTQSLAADDGLRTCLGPPNQLEMKNMSCRCIWLFVYDGLLTEARNTVEQAGNVAVANEIDRGKILRAWANAMGNFIGPQQENPSDAQVIDVLVKAIAKYILRNESSNQTFAGFLAESAGRTQEFGTVRAPLENNLVLTEYARMRQSEYVEKTRMMTAACNLPYYQGLLLFFLAFAFPFFAMLLLVPGKHAGFIQWFVLWLWVKSWDIGFAIVMQLDDILFAMLGINQENLAKNPITRSELQADFTLAMFAMKQTDPTFQLATYYNIIALCLTAIPVVSSQLILGSLSGGVGVVAQGIKALGDDFGAGASNTAGQQVVSTLRHRLQDNVQARAANYYRNISQYRHAQVAIPPTATGMGSERINNRATPAIGSPEKNNQVVMSRDYDPGTQNILYGPNHGGRDANRSLDRMTYRLEDIRQAHLAAQGLRGFAGGWTSPPEIGFRRGLQGPMGTFFDSIKGLKQYTDGFTFKPLEAVYRAQAEYYGNIGEVHLEPAARWATWDAFYCEEGQRLAAMARLWNMLEVPWTAGDSPEIAEGKLEYAFFQEEAKLYASYIEAVGDAQASFLNWEAGIKAFRWLDPPKK